MTIAPQTVAQLCGATRQAITTRAFQHHDGDFAINASCDARTIEVEWDDSLGIQENHAAAALRLLRELGWDERNHLVSGSVGNAYVFVQVEPRRYPVDGLEYAVDDCSGKERVFKTPDEAAGFAVAVAMSGRDDVHIDVLCWNREAAIAYRGPGGDGKEEYDEDPDASVFERIELKCNVMGRVP